jgi:microcystin-dependent protein
VTDPFLAEIRMFSGNFAPTGWALCNGQLMPIQQNTALFSLLGVSFGGNGSTTFGLPDLIGAAPLQQGQGPGLSPRFLGESGGSAAVTLLSSEMPMHTHTVQAVNGSGNTVQPTGARFASAMSGKVGAKLYATGQPANTLMRPQSTGTAGGNQPHDNLPPYLGVTFIIALQGIFPQRP